MNFEVGQQIFGGQIVVLTVTSTYVLIAIAALGDARGPFTIQIIPGTTIEALNALLNALLAVVPKP